MQIDASAPLHFLYRLLLELISYSNLIDQIKAFAVLSLFTFAFSSAFSTLISVIFLNFENIGCATLKYQRFNFIEVRRRHRRGSVGLTEFLGNILFGEFSTVYASLMVLSLILCGLIYCFGSITIGLLGRRDDVTAVQSAHTTTVPRIGGVAFFMSIIALLPLASVLDFERVHVICLLITLLPIMITGLAEDMGWPTPPRRRLLAVVFAGCLMVGMFGNYLPRIGIPILDPLFTFVPVAIVITVFMATGVANAFNLVDGLNGLCGFITIATAVSLAIIADRAELRDISLFLTLLIPIVAGFLTFNFPFGFIFLGDAGAYMIGHTLVWVGIAIVALSANVSPFAILLVFFWPVADTVLAIYRRRMTGRRSDQPDRLHFHQLMMRYLEIRFLGRGRRHLANPVAALCLAPMIIAPQVLGVMFAFDNKTAALSLLAASVAFVLSYMIGIRSAKELPRRRPFNDCSEAATPAE